MGRLTKEQAAREAGEAGTNATSLNLTHRALSDVSGVESLTLIRPVRAAALLLTILCAAASACAGVVPEQFQEPGAPRPRLQLPRHPRGTSCCYYNVNKQVVVNEQCCHAESS